MSARPGPHASMGGSGDRAAAGGPGDRAAAGGAGGREARLLFVCLGNICRSPTAEGVMRTLLERDGLQDAVLLDSAGTGAWHVGESPDRRAAEAAAKRGFALSGSARQVRASDFQDFDLLLAMDSSNASDLMRIAPGEAAAKVKLLREFDPASAGPDLDVPDPYYGGETGFDRVLDLVEAACLGLIERLQLASCMRR